MSAALGELTERGFVVVPGPFAGEEVGRLQAAYDSACAHAAPEDVRVGSSSTRVTDFVNRGAIFDVVYTWPAVLDAARHVVGSRFRLSALHARTLHPGAPAQALHVDVPRTSDAWPMLTFILMVDEFRGDNGATRFVPGSHLWREVPADVMGDLRAAHEHEVLACGPAGSMILFDGSVWHGHSANSSAEPRRSIQGYFVRRDVRAATDFAARMRPETLARLGSAKA